MLTDARKSLLVVVIHGEELQTPVEMKAVILILVGPGRVIQCLKASLFLLLLETERGVYRAGF